MELQLFSQEGVASKIKVSDDIFNIEESASAMHKALRVNESNKRYNLASTLSKAQVRGGGKKPFRQKGTGNARQGSTTNPHFIGGGVAFGPRGVRNFSKKMPIKEKRLALFSALSLVAKEGKLSIISFDKDILKSKDTVKMLSLLPQGKSSIIYDLPHSAITKAIKNVANVSVKSVDSVKVMDLLVNERVIFTKAALEKFEGMYVTQ